MKQAVVTGLIAGGLAAAAIVGVNADWGAVGGAFVVVGNVALLSSLPSEFWVVVYTLLTLFTVLVVGGAVVSGRATVRDFVTTVVISMSLGAFGLLLPVAASSI